MARDTFMVVETTNLIGCDCYSLQSTDNIQNGAIVGKGDLITGETSIYSALADYSKGMFLVANPAWIYDSYRVTDMNEENYVNAKGVAFRAYELKKNKKFKVYNKMPELVVGDYVEYTNGAYAKASGETALKVVNVEEIGFPFCIGSPGTPSTDYGYALGEKTKKYTIEVVA